MDANGANLSWANLAVKALYLTRAGSGAQLPVQSPGNSQPNNLFTFDSSSGSYTFNLKTTGLQAGMYSLNFSVAGDPATYTVPFQVQ